MNKQKVLVIGSSGFLGRQITGILASQGGVFKTHFQNSLYPDSIAYDFFNDDIGSLLDTHKIDVVIFAGMVETSSLEAVQVAMERFAKACTERHVIYLSSDGIFDGQKGLYSEVDTPNSQTLYGWNLAACENIIANQCKSYCIIRPSYIYGFSLGILDNRLTKTREMLIAGKEVMLFDDMFKSPLGVRQVAQAVIDLSLLGYMGIIHVAGPRMSVYEFHRQAMTALNVNTAKLKGCNMPTDQNLLRDTSLDTTVWQKTTNSKPESIQKTLSAQDAA